MKKLVLLIFVVFYLAGCSSETPPEVIYVYVYDTHNVQTDTGLSNEDVIDSGSSVIDTGQVVDSGWDAIGVYDIGFDAGYDIVDTYQGGVEDVYDLNEYDIIVEDIYDAGYDSGSVNDVYCYFCKDVGQEDIGDVGDVDKPMCGSPNISCKDTCTGEIKDSMNNGYTDISKCYYDSNKKCWYANVEKCKPISKWVDTVCYQDEVNGAECIKPKAMPYCNSKYDWDKDCKTMELCRPSPSGADCNNIIYCYWDSNLKCWNYKDEMCGDQGNPMEPPCVGFVDCYKDEDGFAYCFW